MAKAIKSDIPSRIAAEIGARIVSERLRPGLILGREIEASNELHVSRSAYREAIRILIAKGLVHSRPRCGTRVTERAQWHLLDPDLLNWIFAKEPPRELLISLFELRQMIEPEAAALAAEHHSPAQLNDMGRALQIMRRESLDSELGRQADRDFHATLLQASNNPFLVSLATSVMAAVTWSTMFKSRTRRLERDAVPDHVRVFYAISARDPNVARKSMLQLIELAFSDVTRSPPGRK